MKSVSRTLPFALLAAVLVVAGGGRAEDVDALLDTEFEKGTDIDQGSQSIRKHDSLDADAQTMSQQVADLLRQNAELLQQNAEVADLQRQNAELLKQNGELKRENAELKQERAHADNEQGEAKSSGAFDQQVAVGVDMYNNASLFQAKVSTAEPLSFVSAVGMLWAAELACGTVSGAAVYLTNFLKAVKGCWESEKKGRALFKECIVSIIDVSNCGTIATGAWSAGKKSYSICKSLKSKIKGFWAKRKTAQIVEGLPGGEGVAEGIELYNQAIDVASDSGVCSPLPPIPQAPQLTTLEDFLKP